MYEFLKTKGKLKRLLGVWGGLARAKRSGCSPVVAPRLPAAGAWPGRGSPLPAAEPRRYRYRQRHLRALQLLRARVRAGAALFYFIWIWAVVISVCLMGGWFAFGFDFFLSPPAATQRHQSSQTRCRRGFHSAQAPGPGKDRAERWALPLRVPGAEHNLVYGWSLNFFA